MPNDLITQVESWYDHCYATAKFKAQRLYPNEELLRFLGREYFSKTERKNRSNIKVLELGCGSCSNLWMVAKEGFDAYGIDLSKEAIDLGGQMLAHWGVKGDLAVGSMTKLPYADDTFDVVFDVFSAYCLNDSDFKDCLTETFRCLKPGGKFFTYTPSTGSELYTNFKPATKLDEFTLSGILREGAPYFGQEYPFRFISSDHLGSISKSTGFENFQCEKISRTYKNQKEYFEFLSASFDKPDTKGS